VKCPAGKTEVTASPLNQFQNRAYYGLQITVYSKPVIYFYSQLIIHLMHL
jgi:hypothetical protein